LFGLFAKLDLHLAEQLVDRADAVAFDRIRIELALGLDVSEQGSGDDDRLAVLVVALALYDRRSRSASWLNRHCGTCEQQQNDRSYPASFA
jgi:hypothetical protein